MATFTITRDNTTLLSSPLTVNLTVGGTATFGTDYTASGADTFTATAASITLPAGQLSANITVTPVADLVIELDETVILSIVPTAGTSQTGINPSATFTILNDDTFTGNVLLLLNFIGANGSTSIVDTSPNPKPIGIFGNTQILGNRGIFDGSGDYLEISKSVLDLGAVSNYTIEAIVKTNSASLQLIAATYNLPNQVGHLIYRLDTITDTTYTYASGMTPQIGVDVHYALVRDAGNYRVYRQGILINTVAASAFAQNGNFYIGGSPGDNNIGSNWLNGSLAGFKITDIARYNANFTPPTSF